MKTLSAFALLFLSLPAYGQFATYNSAAAWHAATGVPDSFAEDFSWSHSQSLDISQVVTPLAGGAMNYSVVVNAGRVPAGSQIIGGELGFAQLVAQTYGPSSNVPGDFQTLLLDFPTPIRALGFLWGDVTSDGSALRFAAYNGQTLVGSTLLPAASSGWTGFTSTTPVTQVQVSSAGVRYSSFDNFEGVAVPAPAGLFAFAPVMLRRRVRR